ncbi:hypothetical protein [Shewanella sp. TC10]|uniref:hypothetical protein n=1 Tax=Shewanella sp. TC10 TaxID=1419739 RepID=UPI00129EBF21|nr:hypothetical protein [Shewanella sp. TC10]
MIKLTILLVLVLSPLKSFGKDLICPEPVNGPWDKMKESDFTKESALSQLSELKKVYEMDLEVAPEFIQQSNLIFEGAHLRQEVLNSINEPKYNTHAKKAFCEFMKNRAYLVH